MDCYDTQIFAKNLSRLLESHHISQRDIAKILSVSSSTVSSWCTGRKIPRMDKIERLASYFGVLKSDLIEEKPTPVSESGLPSDDELVKLWLDLSPEEAQKVKAFVQGMIANRKEPSSLSE